MSDPAGFNKPTNTKKKGFLTWDFMLSAGIGAAVGITAKTCALSLLCTAGVPALTSMLVACAFAGATVGLVKSTMDYYKAKKEDQNAKLNIKSIFINAAISTVFGSLAYGIAEFFSADPATPNEGAESIPKPEGDIKTGYADIDYDVLEDSDANQPDETAALPQNSEDGVNSENVNDEPEVNKPNNSIDTGPEYETDIDAATTEGEKLIVEFGNEYSDLSTLFESVDEYISDHNITDETFLELIALAKEGDAQALKDIAAAINTEGKVLCIELPKDAALAVNLYEAAIGSGNAQAIIDYAYLLNHGLNGLDADKGTALSLLQDLMNTTNIESGTHKIADCFYEQWSEGYNGKDCVGQIVCSEPVVPQEPINPEPEPPIDEPVTPIENEPEPEAKESSSCYSVFNAKEVRFICEDNDAVFDIGDKVRFYPKDFLPN